MDLLLLHGDTPDTCDSPATLGLHGGGCRGVLLLPCSFTFLASSRFLITKYNTGIKLCSLLIGCLGWFQTLSSLLSTYFHLLWWPEAEDNECQERAVASLSTLQWGWVNSMVGLREVCHQTLNASCIKQFWVFFFPSRQESFTLSPTMCILLYQKQRILIWDEKKQTNMVSKKTVSGLKLIKAQVWVLGGVGDRGVLGGD